MSVKIFYVIVALFATQNVLQAYQQDTTKYGVLTNIGDEGQLNGQDVLKSYKVDTTTTRHQDSTVLLEVGLFEFTYTQLFYNGCLVIFDPHNEVEEEEEENENTVDTLIASYLSYGTEAVEYIDGKIQSIKYESCRMFVWIKPQNANVLYQAKIKQQKVILSSDISSKFIILSQDI